MLTKDQANEAAKVLREAGAKLRNAKTPPKGITAGEVYDRIDACRAAATALERLANGESQGRFEIEDGNSAELPIG